MELSVYGVNSSFRSFKIVFTYLNHFDQVNLVKRVFGLPHTSQKFLRTPKNSLQLKTNTSLVRYNS